MKYWSSDYQNSKLRTYLGSNKEHTFVETKEDRPHCENAIWFQQAYTKDTSRTMTSDTRPLHPFTIKFIKWKTFCVVHPYSGTLN